MIILFVDKDKLVRYEIDEKKQVAKNIKGLLKLAKSQVCKTEVDLDLGSL